MKSLFKKQQTPFVYHRYYHSAQTKWVQKMDVLINGLSRRKLICLLISFIILTGSYFIYNIYTAFSESDFPIAQKTAVISKIRTINFKK
ncbi:hypothetical protein [Flavobacterium sp. KBS0721]|uniref:hypothetical protein n=1 Tax=Flavobacterium sp. KBS0721 TaxID=1179672 RepID=UPI0009900BA1|nr:hypothetical protein [Flavobacterium sp. KBS0721]QDW21204.1 hypothetical protein B0M43_0014150 [Flavobacterium sp. KBS0721]